MRLLRVVTAGITAALLLVTAGASVSAAAPEPSDGLTALGDPRPWLVDSQLRAEVSAADEGEPIEYLIAVQAAPDLEPIKFDREAVVTALKETAERSQRPVIDYLEAHGQEVVNTFWLSNLVHARSSRETLNQSLTSLTAVPGVEALLPVRTLEVPEPDVAPLDRIAPATVEDRTWGLDRIGAHRVWDELGLDGSGVRVAVLDTGVAIDHPDLAGKMATDDPDDPTFPGGWMEWDSAGNPVHSQPHDTHWHGTHVSGTIHGGDNFRGGTAIGSAPGASLMHGLALPGGSGPLSTIIAGMQWTIDPYDFQGNPAGQPADVVNMSFGPQGGGIIDDLVEPIRNMYLAGVLPVASAGNDGADRHGSPGNIYEALATGATDRDDDVADFSGGGVAEAGDFANPADDWPESWIVPDISAPGVEVISSVPAGTFPNDPDAVYGTASGTSMASPHAAATAALVLSGDPGLGAAEIADAVVDTSFFDERYGEQRPNTRFGHGRIDAFQAASRVVLDSGVTGRVTDAGSGGPIVGVHVEVVEADVSARTDGEGRYEFRLSPGGYTLEFSWSGEVVATASVVVAEQAMTTHDVGLGGVSGRVVDAGTEQPVGDVRVEIVETGVSVVTGADGRYRLYAAPGSYTLEFSGFGYEEIAVSGVEVTQANMRTLDVGLDPLPVGSLTGTVTLVNSGHAVPGVTITGEHTPLTTATGADGTYTITGVPIGTYTVAARHPMFPEPPTQQVTVQEGEVAIADFTVACGAQCDLAESWVARYDGSADVGEGGRNDGANAMAVSPDGSRVYVTGASNVTGVNTDYATAAYDAVTGEELWVVRYDGPGHGHDAPLALDVSANGSLVYITGGSNEANSLVGDFATVAYDAATGAELWVARYSGPSTRSDVATSLAVSPDDSRVYVTGQSPGAGQGIPPRDYATVAYDAVTGEELWSTRYDGPSNGEDLVQSMGVSPDGSGVFVTGFSTDPATVWDFATVAYDAADGSQLWVSRYDGPAHASDQASAMTVSPDSSGVFVTGVSAGTGTGFDYATVAYHPTTGSELWVARYNGATNGLDRPADHGIAASPDGSRVYVTGESAGVGTGFAPRDYATVAYEAVNGDEVWAARHSLSQGRDAATALGVSPDGSRVFVTGLSLSPNAGTNYVTVAHDAADGNARWVGQYDGPGTGADFPNALAVSPDGSHVYAAGHSLGVDSGVDFAAVAYDAEAEGEFPVFVPHDLRIEPSAVVSGDPVRIRVAVTNVGTAAGGRDVTLLVDGTVEDSTSVTLEPGQATQVAWTVTREPTGVYAVQVGHLSGDFQVTPDSTGPDVSVSGVVDGKVYGDSKNLPISWTAVDPSGVDTVGGSLDGEPFVSGTTQPLYRLALGEHVLEVTATDEAGNVSTVSVAFTTRTSYQDVAALVERFRSEHKISLVGAIKLQAKLVTAALLDLFGLDKQAVKQLGDFKKLLKDRHAVSDPEVREVLTRDVDVLIADAAVRTTSSSR